MQTEPIHIRELRFCCVKYLVIVATCLFAKIVYKSLSRREPCEYASSFIHQKRRRSYQKVVEKPYHYAS